MKVNNMTLAQCKRIIESDFVSEHKVNGSQVDYFDYKNEILKQYWALSDKSIIKKSGPHVKPGIESFDSGATDLVISINRAFRPWKNLSFEIQARLV